MTEETVPQLDYDARPLYRVTFPIAYKNDVIAVGDLHRLEKVPREGIEKLKLRGTIIPVQPPPLAVLPGWTRRAGRLGKAGIHDAVQLLGVDTDQAAEYMRVKPRTVTRWKREVLCWLKAPEEKRRR